MKIHTTKFPDVLIIEPEIHTDIRGYFMESYNKREFNSHGINIEFIQDNQSLSLKKNTIRGMHFQLHPKAQNKLIRVVSGEIMNVVVDIRQGSPTFKQHEIIYLSSEKKQHLLLRVGFANGFCTLTDNTEVAYKVDQYYSPEHDCAFAWDDPEIGIEWNTVKPILSERDKNAPKFSEIDNNIIYEK
jgi:dTDP-4-dehydrorhamnose 3,5-epimerase